MHDEYWISVEKGFDRAQKMRASRNGGLFWGRHETFGTNGTNVIYESRKVTLRDRET
jgi:hypothetical protein